MEFQLISIVKYVFQRNFMFNKQTKTADEEKTKTDIFSKFECGNTFLPPSTKQTKRKTLQRSAVNKLFQCSFETATQTKLVTSSITT